MQSRLSALSHPDPTRLRLVRSGWLRLDIRPDCTFQQGVTNSLCHKEHNNTISLHLKDNCITLISPQAQLNMTQPPAPCMPLLQSSESPSTLLTTCTYQYPYCWIICIMYSHNQCEMLFHYPAKEHTQTKRTFQVRQDYGILVFVKGQCMLPKVCRLVASPPI